MQSKDYTGCDSEFVLKDVFGYDSFRLLQKDVIDNVLNGHDTLAVMPTGGGKSLCYQIPALIFDGLTVVVSPLISLMQDQVANLNDKGVNAVFLNSSVDWNSYLDSMNSIRRGETKIVYLSPEGLSTNRIREFLRDSRINLKCITIDEAHCVSEWGHDFRPDYLEIYSLRQEFSNAVFLALTATATNQVREDIIRNLKLRNPSVLVSSFNRSNIFLSVKPKRNAITQVIECIKKHDGESGIIYCFSRKQVDLLAEDLISLGYSVLNYHAGLSDSQRSANQTAFLEDKVKIMVATLAFGMGIDKPNVRYVIHYDLPKSLEQYYQEIGRAGRDGKKSEALLLYTASDIQKIKYFINESTDSKKARELLQGIINYATHNVCRRKSLLGYFGEVYVPDQDNDYCCDFCNRIVAKNSLIDMTIPSQKLMSCIIRTGSRFGASYVVDVLIGSRQKRIIENNHNQLSTWGIGTELTRDGWLNLCNELVNMGYLTKSLEYSVLIITNDGLSALRARDKIMLPSTVVDDSDIASETRLKFPKPEKSKKSFYLHKKRKLK